MEARRQTLNHESMYTFSGLSGPVFSDFETHKLLSSFSSLPLKLSNEFADFLIT